MATGLAAATRVLSGMCLALTARKGGGMKRTLLIGVAALTFACGGSDRSRDNAAGGAPATAQPGAAQSGSGVAPIPPAVATSRDPEANQTVTLAGCLQGPGEPAAAATGTSGTRARARAEGPEGVATGGGGAAGRFVLVNATAEAPGSAGVGANGAGGSGGPLVSGVSSFDLDALPAGAAAHVNKQVRITGRLDARPTSTASTATRRLVVENVQVVSDTCERR
jgi:hypothetical protein